MVLFSAEENGEGDAEEVMEIPDEEAEVIEEEEGEGNADAEEQEAEDGDDVEVIGEEAGEEAGEEVEEEEAEEGQDEEGKEEVCVWPGPCFKKYLNINRNHNSYVLTSVMSMICHKNVLFVCLFGFNVALKHLRSYHDGACL